MHTHWHAEDASEVALSILASHVVVALWCCGVNFIVKDLPSAQELANTLPYRQYVCDQ